MPQPGAPLLGSARFSRRIVIEKDARTMPPDDYGNVTPVYEPWITRWARIEYLGGDEQVAAGQVLAERRHRITMPADYYTEQITPEMRVRLGERVLNITAVEHLKEQQIVVLHTREVVEGGT